MSTQTSNGKGAAGSSMVPFWTYVLAGAGVLAGLAGLLIAFAMA